MRILSPTRRSFLSALGASAASLPILSLPGFVQAAGPLPLVGNILVLVELAGGNDGLNTVVPISDPTYRALRPNIGITARDGLSIDADTVLHPSLRTMANLWEQGDVQIVEGVGYPNPNRSHFRSIEIWNAGDGANSVARTGWIASAFDGNAPPASDADGVVLGGDMGPLDGEGRFTAMRDEQTFLDTLENLPDLQHPVRPNAAKSPLEHVLDTYESAHVTGDAIRRKLEASRARRWNFPQTEIGEQLRTAARLLDAGVEVPVLKVVQDGYDTHDAQPFQHAALLEELSDATTAFANAMRDIGIWGNVTVLTYSEFGRTARENTSGGTDHGTAAPVFAMGGNVAGGLSGARASLDQLVDGEMAHTTDYRSLYRAVLSDLWQIDAPQFDVGGAAIRLLDA